MAISGAGRGPPPLPLKSTSTACCCGAEVARWEHTRKGANSYLAGELRAGAGGGAATEVGG